jgi:mannosyltransferase
MRKSLMNGRADEQSSGSRKAAASGPIDQVRKIALPGAVLLALTLRLIALNSKSVFADELASLNFTKMSWAGLWHLIVGHEANMSLYYLLLRIWVGINQGVAFARLFSVIAGVATIPVLYQLGKKLFSESTAILACFVFAANAFHITYSQAARGYSLAVLLVSVSTLFFVKVTQEPGHGSALAYVVSSTASLYSHFFAGFVLLAHCFSLAFKRETFHARRQVFYLLAVGLLAAPLLVFASIHQTAPIFWVQKPTLKDVYHFFTYLTGSGLKFGLALLGIIFAAREWYVSRSGDPLNREKAWGLLLVACWLLLPTILTLAISLWKPVFSPRFLMICLPAMAILVAEGLMTLRPHWLGYSVAAMLLVSSVTALPGYYRSPGIEDWKGVTDFLAQNLRPNDVIVIEPAYRDVFNYSVNRFATALPTHQVVTDFRPVRDLHTNVNRIWILFPHPAHVAENNVPALPRKYVRGPDAHFVGIDVLQYVSHPAL